MGNVRDDASEKENIKKALKNKDRALSRLVLSGYNFTVGISEQGDVYLTIDEFGEPIYMSKTEVGLLSVALQHALEEFAR